MRLLIDTLRYAVLIMAHYGWHVSVSDNLFGYGVWCSNCDGWGVGYFTCDHYTSLQFYLLGLLSPAIEIVWTSRTNNMQRPKCNPKP
jgi:hypothetical protein